jgi:hypothetical protein
VQAAPDCSETALIHIADILARIASVEEGLILLLYGENMNSSEEERCVHVLIFLTIWEYSGFLNRSTLNYL